MLKTLLVGALTLALPALASAALTKAQFLEALNGAMGDRNMKSQTVQGEQLALEEMAGNGEMGMWRVGVINACLMPGGDNSTSNNYGKMMRIKYLLVVANAANGFAFAVNSNAASAHQKAAVEKALADRLKTLNGDLGIAATMTPKDGGTYQIVGELAGSPSAGQLRDKLAKLITQVRLMVCDVYNAMEAADLGQWKALKGGELSTLDKSQFVALYHHFKDPAYERKGNAPHGTWAVQLDKKNKGWIENYGDRMILWVWVQPPSVPSEELKKVVEAKLAALPRLDGATSIETGFFAPEFWAGQVFPYAGMTGKQLVKILDGFSDDDGLDFKKEVRKAVESAY